METTVCSTKETTPALPHSGLLEQSNARKFWWLVTCAQTVTRRNFVIVPVRRLKNMCFYTAHRRFNKSLGDEFTRFIEWTGFYHIAELVSADTVMCPNLVNELIDEDWLYNVHADNRIFWFHDVAYLAKRIGYNSLSHNILSLSQSPGESHAIPQGFQFCGYDILDSYESISVLTNCGGFPGIFDASDVNRYALLDDRRRADQIAMQLRTTRPDCDHCRECSVWSIARYVRGG